MLRPYFPKHIMSGHPVGAPLGVAPSLTLPWPSPRPSPPGRGGLDSRFRGNDGWQTPPLHVWRGGRGVKRSPTHLRPGRARRAL